MNIHEPQHPRVIPLKPKNDSLEIQPIIASVLQSEKESRELLRSLLLDQRSTFMKELELSRLTAAAAVEANNIASSESKNQERR
jgi:dsDNA-binding SOS-regulon protein